MDCPSALAACPNALIKKHTVFEYVIAIWNIGNGGFLSLVRQPRGSTGAVPPGAIHGVMMVQSFRCTYVVPVLLSPRTCMC